MQAPCMKPGRHVQGLTNGAERKLIGAKIAPAFWVPIQRKTNSAVLKRTPMTTSFTPIPSCMKARAGQRRCPLPWMRPGVKGASIRGIWS